jgi:hypothetical protein
MVAGESAAAADGCFGAQTCTVDEDPDVVAGDLSVARPAQPGGIPGRAGGNPPLGARDVLIDVPVTHQYAPVG